MTDTHVVLLDVLGLEVSVRNMVDTELISRNVLARVCPGFGHCTKLIILAGPSSEVVAVLRAGQVVHVVPPVLL